MRDARRALPTRQTATRPFSEKIMQNARNALNAGVVGAALQTIVYGGAATYGLYNRCASSRVRERRDDDDDDARDD